MSAPRLALSAFVRNVTCENQCLLCCSKSLANADEIAPDTPSDAEVTADEFRALVAAGTCSTDTKVWAEGMDGWLPFG